MFTTLNAPSGRRLPRIRHLALASGLVIFFLLETASAAPTITSQPKSQIVIAGSNVGLSVTALGIPPLSYQWKKEGANLANQTNSTLTLNNIQPVDQGTYSVVVSDSSGSVTSSFAMLGTGLNIQWQKILGGDGDDYATAVKQTSDGGFVIGGHSGSGTSGNKTNKNFGSYDFWVLKLDSEGNTMWERSFGGSGNDFLYSLQSTSDGGYILGGSSASSPSGNKASVSFGGYDYWVVKLDGSGIKQWEKTFGGTSHDFCSDIEQTPDGGYIAGGASGSGVNGNKTNASFGGFDYWIVRLNSNGDKIWEKTFGGDNEESFGSLQSTSDGGYLLGGHSLSEISGNKTNLGFGGNDYWVVKMDANGNKIWEQTLEGNNSDHYRAVRLNTGGSKVWDKTFGGDRADYLFALERDSQGRYILGGYSTSENAGDKTSASFGSGDYWMVAVDPNGNKLWDKAVGGAGTDILSSFQESQDGGYILAGYSDSGISGNKAMPTLGGYDYWLVKLAVTTSTAIFGHPQSQTNSVGADISLSVGANNALGYQWRKNGNTIIGATLSSLNFPYFRTNDVGRYDVLVMGGNGDLISSNAYLFITGEETKPPTISISSPKANQRITNNLNFTMTGTAKDTGVGVAQVFYRLNDGNFEMANGTTNWSAALTLAPGTNRVEVKSIDFGLMESPVVRRLFFEVTTSPLILTTSGFGSILSTTSTIGTPTHLALLEVGRAYEVQAIPNPDNVFSNWIGSATSPNAIFKFVMQSNMTLTANFVPNPLIGKAGSYSGLFYETNLSHRSAGFFTMKVRTNFIFSGRVILDGDPISMSGKFNVDGTVTKFISRAKLGKPDLTLTLALDFANESDRAIGTVSSDGWSAALKADRATFGVSNPALGYTGNYTMLLPGFTNPASGPPGFGYGLIKIKPDGFVVVTGQTADGMKMSQSVSLSKDGQWPLYVFLYKATRNYTNWLTPPALVIDKSYYFGSSYGWVTFTNNAPAGEIRLIKTGWTSPVYPGGFTNKTAIIGSHFLPGSSGTPVINMTDGTIWFTYGNLSSALSGTDILIKANNVAVVTSDSAIKFSINSKTGFISAGSFQHPQNTNAVTVFKGAILQDQNVGAGHFLGTNHGGLFILE